MAVLLAVWPALSAGLGETATYDPLVALTSLTAVALVWYTFFTHQTLEHARRTALEQSQRLADERTRQRQSIATAVLAELRTVCGRLATIRSQGPTVARDILSHPMLEQALLNPSLFQPDTVQALTSTLRHLSDVQIVLEEYPHLVSAAANPIAASKDPQQAEDDKVATYLSGKTRAGWAFNATVELVERLKDEGGLMPTLLPEQPRALFDHPPLLADPFDANEKGSARRSG